MEYLEEMVDDEMDETSFENLSTDLSYLADHPFNLNTITKKDLDRLPFLSDIQIENLLYYLYRYAPLTSIYELRNVEDLDLQTIEYLLPFVYLGEEKEESRPPSPEKIVRYAKQEILIRYDNCFQEKAGYKHVSKEEKSEHPNRYYLGEKFYTSLKYGFRYKNKIQLGFVAEKDPGEAFWNNQHSGFDYYSMHVEIKDLGFLKYLLAGDYRASFGQGLVLNTDFSMAKTSDVININKKASGIKRHNSTGESNAFRGLAFTLGFQQTNISLFYSQQKTDASVDDSTVFSFKTDGYHRTFNDLLKKNESENRLLGGNFSWQNDYLSMGITAIYYDFGGKKLNQEWKPYNMYNLRDVNNYNAGFNYLWKKKKFIAQGETAIGKNGAWASLNTLQFHPASYCNIVLLQRYYAKDYQAKYASAAGSSSVQNENGYYLGTSFTPVSYWKISASADWVEYPWLKYLVDMPSRATEIILRADYVIPKHWSMNGRYKKKVKSKNVALDSQPTKAVLPVTQHSLRYQLNYQSEKGFRSKTQVNMSINQSDMQQTTRGYMFSQSLGFVPVKFPLQGDVYIAYFHTDNWDTRISAYEKNILYAFSAPSFYGEGIRCCLTMKWSLSSVVSLYLKGAWTHYFDRDVISSGLEEIQGKNKTDMYCLLKWKF